MHEDVHYSKPFLDETIVRVDFAAPVAALQKTIPPKLSKALSERFPIVEPPAHAVVQQVKFEIGVEPVQEKLEFDQWNFFGKEREKQLCVSSRFFFISYKKYSSFEDLQKDFAVPIREFESLYPDTTVSRLGLRYVNKIEIDELKSPTVWSEYIVPQLFQSLEFFPPDKLMRLIQVVELKCDDVLSLRFQFGMPNPDYPAVIKRPQFILDLDCYAQTAHEMANCMQYLVRAHEEIQDLFEKSITPILRERMNARTATPVQD